mgnify:CR=1 FL=1|jgi:hypothetical protein
MPTGYEQIRPLKSIVQSNGEVILAEFTDNDFISIESGGTGATSKVGARISLEVIKYNEYQNLNSFEPPTSSQLALNYDDGKMYYSHNNEWISISDTLAKHSTDMGFNNVESFVFNDRFITVYNDGILEVDLYIDDITGRLDVIEGDVNTSGSILHTVQENIDLLLDGVIPELDTLKEIATSLGDAVDIKVQLDNIGTNLATETSDRITADNAITTLLSIEIADRIADDNTITSNLTSLSDKINIIESDVDTDGSILHTVQENINLLLDGVIPELDTLKEIATSLGDTVDFKSQYDITVSDLLALNTKVDGIDSQVGNSQQILDIVQGQVDNLLDGVVPELNTLQKIAISLGNAVDIKDQLDVVSNNLTTETTDRTAADDVLTTNLATEVSDRIDDINNISSILNNFSYDGHDNNVLNDTHPTGLMLDKQTGKYKPSLLNLGHFIPFKRKNGDVDDINLISTFDGNVLIDSKLRFWQHNGIQDDISFIIQ